MGVIFDLGNPLAIDSFVLGVAVFDDVIYDDPPRVYGRLVCVLTGHCIHGVGRRRPQFRLAGQGVFWNGRTAQFIAGMPVEHVERVNWWLIVGMQLKCDLG